MSLSTAGRTWDAATSPAAVALARRFETAWRASDDPDRRPDLDAHWAEAGRHPGVRLALLRTDLNLRWEAGERPAARAYRARFPDLADDAFVALIYEEFCLREETGESPDARDFLARHAEVAPALQRVLDIHGLVGAGAGTTTLSVSAAAPEGGGVPFPAAGETIAGFRLMEELGRGAFARVFRAEERQLADRPVALKVARAGSREPQTLARLQHTHIVPVYSYRTDPATGLHLLCMPFFGRVTLARVLADPLVRVARGGAELVAAVDRLGGGDDPPAGRGSGRAALAGRDFPRALAWWGARLAEALDHAHERGVLHRDVKPSNVLVTADGMPMLLDFNLAVAPARDGGETVPGGTLDYMAPEQIDELAGSPGAAADARSDVFGLGVVLDEALRGARPFPPPRGASSGLDFLRRAADDRRAGPPNLLAARPEVPAALGAVVRRCLEPDPADRYATAADLAADLRAVADDLPLRFAREPIPDRLYRRARRHRRALATAAVVVPALVVSAALLVRERVEGERRRADVKGVFDEAVDFETAGDLEQARVLFDSAARLADRPATAAAARRRAAGAADDLASLRQKARFRAGLVRRALGNRRAAADLDAAAESLRFRLLDWGDDPDAVARALDDALRPFRVNDLTDWTRRPDLVEGLDDARRTRLAGTVEELLFLHALALDGRGDPASLRRGLGVCHVAARFAPSSGPWRALRSRLAARLAGRPDPAPVESTRPDDTAGSARVCFQWGALRLAEGRPDDALPWLKRAARLDEENAWYQFYLGRAHDRPAADDTAALRYYDAAVALRPRSPYARFARARLYRAGHSPDLAREELLRALADGGALPAPLRDPAFEDRLRSELALVR